MAGGNKGQSQKVKKRKAQKAAAERNARASKSARRPAVADRGR